MTHLNYQSDFIVREAFLSSEGVQVGLPDDCDVTLIYRTDPYGKYVASRVGGVYTNCQLTNNNNLLVIFNNHRLGRGTLTRTARFEMPNGIMHDGYLSLKSPENTGIVLWQHESETHGVIDCDAVMNYVKGDATKPPVFEPGAIVSGAPNSAPTLSLTMVGETADGSPLYSISGSIPKGEGLHILGAYDTLLDLVEAHPLGNNGDVYLLATGELYTWDDATASWIFAGRIKGDQGPQGLPPVLEVGTITTGTVGTDVSASLEQSGISPAGNPIYKLSLTIPRGADGTPAPRPLGSMEMWPGLISAIPENYALCDGRTLLVSDYPELYAILGNIYGGAAGLSFKLPNMSRQSPIGYDPNPDNADYSIGKTGGAASINLKADQMPSHNHTFNDYYFIEAKNFLDGVDGNDLLGYNTRGPSLGGSIDNDNSSFPYKTHNTESSGAGLPIDIRSPYLTVAFVMRLR